ncbi:MAG TPA: hypothetical protein VFL47_08990, partial [Flavisolibacter sp.]|nr:hypothetical protein [Flavisolibacter sp.]
MRLLKKRCLILLLIFCTANNAFAQKPNRPSAPVKASPAGGEMDRVFWSNMLYKIVSPVVFNLAAGTL